MQTPVAPVSGPEPSGWLAELQAHRETWARKEILRAIYRSWYARVKGQCVPGRTVEIGGGGGHFKEFWPELISSDIVRAPWLDFQADCLRLPIRNGAAANVVEIDMIHHLADLDSAFAELRRVLRLGGHLVMIEPFISPFANLVRMLFHHEHVDLKRENIFGPDKRPEQGNNGIPTKVFWHERDRFETRFVGFRLLNVELLEPLVYPLTGGFGHHSLLPQSALRALRRIEPALKPLYRWMAFKMLVVAEAR
jgi:SAM-dependent methyltransferase